MSEPSDKCIAVTQHDMNMNNKSPLVTVATFVKFSNLALCAVYNDDSSRLTM